MTARLITAGSMTAWHVYLIECRDGSIYTGVAIDVDRRYAQHVAGKGARYTRAHPPLRLLARFACADRAAACRAEYVVKQLSASQKRGLCECPERFDAVVASADSLLSRR